MKALQIIESAYRCTIEEQDDPAVWITHAMKGAGAELDVLLRGNAVNYVLTGQDASGLSFGARQQTNPPQLDQDIAKLIEKGVEVYVAEEVKRYIVDLALASRQHPDVYLGSSPRGSLALFRTSQTRAAMAGRDYVIPDDVKALAEVTLAHRIIVGPAARIKDIEPDAIVQEILDRVTVPGAQVKA